MFNPKKPTTQMLGRWQPWHPGHTALFKKALLETGQVCIMVRENSMFDGATAFESDLSGKYQNSLYHISMFKQFTNNC